MGGESGACVCVESVLFYHHLSRRARPWPQVSLSPSPFVLSLVWCALPHLSWRGPCVCVYGESERTGRRKKRKTTLAFLLFQARARACARTSVQREAPPLSPVSRPLSWRARPLLPPGLRRTPCLKPGEEAARVPRLVFLRLCHIERTLAPRARPWDSARSFSPPPRRAPKEGRKGSLVPDHRKALLFLSPLEKGGGSERTRQAGLRVCERDIHSAGQLARAARQ